MFLLRGSRLALVSSRRSLGGHLALFIDLETRFLEMIDHAFGDLLARVA